MTCQPFYGHTNTNRVLIRETPFNLVYGTEALIPVEIIIKPLRLSAFKENGSLSNSKSFRENLNLVEEQRDREAIQIATYHKRVASYYNSWVRNKSLKEGDLVLKTSVITNALREDGKLQANWEGPYHLQKMIGPNTYIFQTLQGKTMGKTLNTNHLKLYSSLYT